QIRPIDDAAMLALAEKPLSYITSPTSIDAARPLTVQIPQKVAQDLRRSTRAGTIMRLDPKLVMKQQHDERGDDEEEAILAQMKKEEEEAEAAAEAERRSAAAAAAADISISALEQELLDAEEGGDDLFAW